MNRVHRRFARGGCKRKGPTETVVDWPGAVLRHHVKVRKEAFGPICGELRKAFARVPLASATRNCPSIHVSRVTFLACLGVYCAALLPKRKKVGYLRRPSRGVILRAGYLGGFVPPKCGP